MRRQNIKSTDNVPSRTLTTIFYRATHSLCNE